MEVDSAPELTYEPTQTREEVGRFRLGISNGLLVHRVSTALLLFTLPLLVGYTITRLIIGSILSVWSVWVFVTHLVYILLVIVSLKQYKRALFTVCVVIHGLWLLLCLIFAIVIGVRGQEMAGRIVVPLCTLMALFHCLAIIGGIQTLKEPIRPLPTTNNLPEDDDINSFRFATTQAEAVELDDLEDGLGISSLHVSPSTPTGWNRRLPLVLQILSILLCIAWPLFLLDVLLMLIIAHIPLLNAVSIAYHYSMLLWCIGSVIVSFGFRHKTRLFISSLAGFAFIVYLISLVALKVALTPQSGAYGFVLIAINFFILVPWASIAYYIGNSYFDYSNVPVCCG